MSRLPSPAAIQAAAPIFAALGDPTRLQLITRLLAEGPISITELSEGIDMTRQAVTKHLRTLATAGLARDRRQGREQLWELQPKPLADAQRYLDLVSAQWDRAIDRLRAHVEG